MTDIFDVDNDVCTAIEPPDWHIELTNARAVIAKCKADMRWFCERVENGEVRSTKSYHRFKKALAAISAFEKGEL